MQKYLFACIFLCCSFFQTTIFSQIKTGYPVADGTFIQNDLVRNWDDNQWQKELAALKEVGMHYIILAPTLHTNKNGYTESVYPSRLPEINQKQNADLVDNCLRNAARQGFKVFLGLNFDEKWWDAQFSYEWLKDQMETGNKVADELIKNYKNKYGETMYGWYWVWEVDNIHCKTAELQDALASLLNVNLDHLHKITPSMPFMLCPFMNYRLGTAEENGRLWKRVFAGTHFKDGDIFAPQDCIGAGGLILDTLDIWFREMKKAVDTKPGLLFWSDAETFDQRFWTIAPLNRFIQQMNIVQPYVSNIISFAYSHYYSPNQVNGNYHKCYAHYVQTGLLPNSSLKGIVSNLQIVMTTDNKPRISWRAPSDSNEIAGYYVYRNQELVANIQYDRKNKKNVRNTFIEKAPLGKGTYKYEICAYSFTGVPASKKSIECMIN